VLKAAISPHTQVDKRVKWVAYAALVFLLTTALYLLFTEYQFQQRQSIAQRSDLNADIATLRQRLAASQKALIAKDRDLTNQLAAKDAEIKKRDDQIASLQKETSALKSSPSRPSAAPPRSAAPATSIYDRISASPSFHDQIMRALNLLKEYDPATYSMVNQQVGTIFELPQCSGVAGVQVKRDIYIASCGATDIEVASVVSHEATHVYNVYVRGIYSYNTREQELPAYQAQLATAQKLGAPQSYLNFINSGITYWSSQP
jgi:hypothetical protein